MLMQNITARYAMLCRAPRETGAWRTTFEIGPEFFYAPFKTTTPPQQVLEHTWYTNFGYAREYIPSRDPEKLWGELQARGFYFKFVRISLASKAKFLPTTPRA